MEGHAKDEKQKKKKSGSPMDKRQIMQKLDKVQAKLNGLKAKNEENIVKLRELEEASTREGGGGAPCDSGNLIPKIEEIDARIDKLKTKKEHLVSRLQELEGGAGGNEIAPIPS